jgi:hypothetical protein
VHDAGHHLSVHLGGDRHREHGPPVEVVDRTVDGVDDPGHSGAAEGAAGLFAQDRVVRAYRPQPGPDQRLGLPVGLGDDIGERRLGPGQLHAAASPGDDQLAGLMRHVDGQQQQLLAQTALRSRGAHSRARRKACASP